MSLNLGREAHVAAHALAANADWARVREGLVEQVRQAMNRALDAPADQMAVSIGYARAMRDLWVAFEAATTNTPVARVQKPAPAKE